MISKDDATINGAEINNQKRSLRLTRRNILELLTLVVRIGFVKNGKKVQGISVLP